ncbi:hypothetical protein C8Q78DRAFT_639875 [Trametes maxima]|nr:hypothetical protein C8Q78DRAFT_639875 [Trametes maxima]
MPLARPADVLCHWGAPCPCHERVEDVKSDSCAHSGGQRVAVLACPDALPVRLAGKLEGRCREARPGEMGGMGPGGRGRSGGRGRLVSFGLLRASAVCVLGSREVTKTPRVAFQRRDLGGLCRRAYRGRRVISGDDTTARCRRCEQRWYGDPHVRCAWRARYLRRMSTISSAEAFWDERDISVDATVTVSAGLLFAQSCSSWLCPSADGHERAVR